MTTSIKSATRPTEKALKVEASVVSDSAVYLNIQGTGDRDQIHVKVSDLLDAVRSELGVLIIDKADNPMSTEQAVAIIQSVQGIGRTPTATDLASAVETARSLVAAVDQIEKSPPVDEQQVEQIWNALTEVGMDDADGPTPHLVATRLATAGYRIEKVQS